MIAWTAEYDASTLNAETSMEKPKTQGSLKCSQTSNLTYRNRIHKQIGQSKRKFVSQIHTDVIPDKKVHKTLYDQERIEY